MIVKHYDKSEERLSLRSCKNVNGLDVCFTKSKVNEIGFEYKCKPISKRKQK